MPRSFCCHLLSSDSASGPVLQLCICSLAAASAVVSHRVRAHSQCLLEAAIPTCMCVVL